jgi:tetratricopeptide (TPR) repeat protein
LPFVHFHRQFVDENDPEVRRDLGIALIETARMEGVVWKRGDGRLRQRVGELSLPHLELATRRDPEDFEAWDAKAAALWMVGRNAEAMAAHEAILKRLPHRQSTLEQAAKLASELNQGRTAAGYWRRAIAVSPYQASYHHGLAYALLQAGDWQEAAEACRQALQLNPASIEVRKILVTCYLELGDRERAQREFDLLMRFEPAEKEALREWFARRTQ